MKHDTILIVAGDDLGRTIARKLEDKKSYAVVVDNSPPSMPYIVRALPMIQDQTYIPPANKLTRGWSKNNRHK